MRVKNLQKILREGWGKTKSKLTKAKTVGQVCHKSCFSKKEVKKKSKKKRANLQGGGRYYLKPYSVQGKRRASSGQGGKFKGGEKLGKKNLGKKRHSPSLRFDGDRDTKEEKKVEKNSKLKKILKKQKEERIQKTISKRKKTTTPIETKREKKSGKS